MGQGFLDIANDYYRSKIDHISVSELKLFNYSPYTYKYTYLDKNKKQSTRSQSLGTLFHMALLEPELFKDEVVAFKDLRVSAALSAKGSGKTICRQDEYEAVIAARDAVLANTYVADILGEAKKETSVFWKWPGLGIDCKCRFDAINHQKKIILDVKTCQSISKFKQQIDWYGYDLQAAFYTECAKSQTGEDHIFQFLVVEMEAPYLFKVFEVTPQLNADARARVERMLLAFKTARDSNYYPHPSEEIEMLYPKNKSQVMYEEIGDRSNG